MSDIFDSIGDAVGGALDFVLPTTERRGAGFSFSDLVDTGTDFARNSVLGAVGAVDDVFRSEASLREKLFMGGLVAGGVAGTAFGARHLAAERKMARQLESPVGWAGAAAVRNTSPEAEMLGLKPRWAPDSPEGASIVRQHPGIKARTADIIGSQDFVTTARTIVSPEVGADSVRLAAAADVVARYADTVTDVTLDDPNIGKLGGAQLDFAKVDTALDNGIIKVYADDLKGKGPGVLNGRLSTLWDRFKQRPETLTDPEKDELVSLVKMVGDATSHVTEPDLSFDAVARITRIELTKDGAVPYVSIPDWDANSVLYDPEVRSARFRALNVRALAPRGKEIFRRLYNMGIEDQTRRELGMPGTLPRPLKKGSGWYPKAAVEIDEALPGLSDVKWVDKQKLTAAVSLTSEAQDWDGGMAGRMQRGNVATAVAVLKQSNTPEVLDPDFQEWLRDGTFEDAVNKVGLRRYTGMNAARHEALFETLHAQARDGNQLTTVDLKKVLRLASESAESVFRSTSGRKQKSFYRNLLGDGSVVTVDRHQHDAFFGIASGSDFKLLEQYELDDSVYDIMSDTVRELADELGVEGYEIQGVVWETWKALKENHRRDSWKNGDPFRLPEADGSENVVFEALQGRSGTNVEEALRLMRPGLPLVTAADGRGIFVLPDERLGVLGKPDVQTARNLRHLYPALELSSGVSQWDVGRPRQVLDLEQYRNGLRQQLEGHQVETWSATAWSKGHPATRPGHHIVLDLPDGFNTNRLSRFGSLDAPAAAMMREMPADSPVFRAPVPAGLRADVTVDDFVAARRAADAADIEKSGAKATDFLTIADPIALKNHRLFLNEDGTAGFAISPEGDLQQLFNNSGIRGYGEDLAHYAVSQGVRTLDAFDGKLPEIYGRVGFVEASREPWNPEYDPQGRPEGPDVVYMELPESRRRVQRRVRQAAVTIDPARAGQLHQLVDELEALGARVSAVYSPTPPAGRGWAPVRDHVYQDGVNMMVVRSADPEVQAYNGFGGWVRKDDAKLLPRKNLDARKVRQVELTPVQPGVFSAGGVAHVLLPSTATAHVDPTRVTFGGKAPTHVGVSFGAGPVPQITFGFDDVAPQADVVARVSGRQLILDALPLGGKDDRTREVIDLHMPAMFIDTMGDIGFEPSRIRLNVGDEAVRSELLEPTVERGRVTLVTGDMIPEMRLGRHPLPHWQEKYGIDFDPSWRDRDGRVHTLPDEYLEEFDSVFERFMREHHEYARLLGFNRMGVTAEVPSYVPQTDAGVMAWFGHGDGRAEIGLNAADWANPEGILAERLSQMGPVRNAKGKIVAPNWISPNLPATPGAILAHELGHLMHFAVRRSFPTDDAMLAWEKDTIRKLRGRMKKKDAQLAVSGYGAMNFDEFVAEAVAEAIFSPSPRSVPIEIYRTLRERFEENRSFKRKAGWAA